MEEKAIRTITAQGEAQIKAVPDEVELSLGVETRYSPGSLRIKEKE
jgi:hypothetical protein